VAADGVTFEEAWDGRIEREVAGLRVAFIGREALVRNKLASGRAKDRLDVEVLGEVPQDDGSR
jgi:hypothetical protein